MKMKSYVIYKVSNGSNFTYVGMTTQPLATRYRQHKADALNEKCSISSRLCQKQPPKDLKALHRRLRDNAANFSINKIKEVKGSYAQAKSEELKVKRRLSSVK